MIKKLKVNFCNNPDFQQGFFVRTGFVYGILFYEARIFQLNFF